MATETSPDTLSSLRHTLAHVLAAAVRELYPHARPTLGPAIDTGFYYDFDFSGGPKPGDQDLAKIEQKMRELLKKWDLIVGAEVTELDARTLFAHNQYKLELIDEIVARKEPLTLYHSSRATASTDDTASVPALFTDLCRGGHMEHPNKDIPSTCFTLDRIAGAYWRGDEKNTMLTRIYGLAFESKEALAAYKHQREEAERRDHRKLGKELGLFFFSELVGPGLPLWTPKGTIIRELLNDYVWELRKARGFMRVTIPHITKKELYETSGHWSKFADELFKIQTREGHLFAMKPMNCPHHTQIFDNTPKSYRDMPQRYAETTMVYRDEQSGELSGLSRVLSITQDDAHVFCRYAQIEEEMISIWDIIDTFYRTFGFTGLSVRFSRHDPEHFENYIGTTERWAMAEEKLLAVIMSRTATYTDGVGEAAMYGPKIDFMANDALGRTMQVATIQLDLNMPKNFGLTCVNEKGEQEDVAMIHCAIMGSIERFMTIVIEHYAGAFPLWLAPVQLRILPIGEAHHAYATEVHKLLQAADIRVELDQDNESLGKRIRRAKLDKLPYFAVVGDKEVEAHEVTLEARDGTSVKISPDALVADVRAHIQNRSA
jgi:threonyl-tRNA synthetase